MPLISVVLDSSEFLIDTKVRESLEKYSFGAKVKVTASSGEDPGSLVQIAWRLVNCFKIGVSCSVIICCKLA